MQDLLRFHSSPDSPRCPFLSTDIIAGVASAADPVKSQAAAERLARIGSANAASEASATASEVSAAAASETSAPPASASKRPAAPKSFEDALNSTLFSASTPGGVKPGLTALAAKAVDGRKGAIMGQTPSALTPAQKFEAFVLQSFVELMLPKNAEDIYGSGIAGENWKSMLAEKMAAEMARTGKVGVAAYLDKAKAGPSSVATAQPTKSASPLTSYLSVLPYTDDRN